MSTTAWIFVGLGLWMTHSFCFFLGILWAASRAPRSDEFVVLRTKSTGSHADGPGAATNAVGSKPSRSGTIRHTSHIEPSMADTF